MLSSTIIAPPTNAQDNRNWIAQLAVSSQKATISPAIQKGSPPPSIKALIVYADNVEEEKYRIKLDKVLKAVSRQVDVKIYSTQCEIIYGDMWQKTDCLESSDLILLLVGPDFVSSDFCYCKELKDTVERHYSHLTHVVPVYLRPCLLRKVPFGQLQFYPTQVQGPVSKQDEDSAFEIIAEGIIAIIIDHLI